MVDYKENNPEEIAVIPLTGHKGNNVMKYTKSYKGYFL